MTPAQHLAALEAKSPRLAANLRLLPPQQLAQLLQTKDNK